MILLLPNHTYRDSKWLEVNIIKKNIYILSAILKTAAIEVKGQIGDGPIDKNFP